MIIYEKSALDYKPEKINWMKCETLYTEYYKCCTTPALQCNYEYSFFNNFYRAMLRNSTCFRYATLCASMTCYCDGIRFASCIGGGQGDENAYAEINADWLVKKPKGSFKGDIQARTNWQAEGNPYICFKDNCGHSTMISSANGANTCLCGCFNFTWDESTNILCFMPTTYPTGSCYYNYFCFNLTGWDLNSLQLFVCGDAGSQNGGGEAIISLCLGYYSTPKFEEIKGYYERFF